MSVSSSTVSIRIPHTNVNRRVENIRYPANPLYPAWRNEVECLRLFNNGTEELDFSTSQGEGATFFYLSEFQGQVRIWRACGYLERDALLVRDRRRCRTFAGGGGRRFVADQPENDIRKGFGEAPICATDGEVLIVGRNAP